MRAVAVGEEIREMRITVISHAYQDERYLKALDAMAKLPAIELSLIHPNAYQGVECCWEKPHSVLDLPVPVVFGARQGAFLYRPFALARALDVSDPEVILHEQEVYALGSAQIAFAACRRFIPLVQFVWENVDRSFSFPRRALRGFVLERVSEIIAGSERTIEIHREWGFGGRIAKSPQMGVTVRSAPSVRPARHSKGLKTFKACFVGRLVLCKGVDCLLRAIEGLYRRGITISCVIAGEGGERRRLERLAERLGVWTQVRFLGQLAEEQVRDLLRSSDALVLPSRKTPAWEEQFGLVLAEAMAEGTVTVGSKTGAIPEVIGMEELLFEQDDVEGLVAILDRLATDSQFFLDCKRSLWQRARDKFSAERIAVEKVELLQRALRSSTLIGCDAVGVDQELRA